MNRWDELDEQSKRKTIIFLVLVGLALLWLTWPTSDALPVKRRPPHAAIVDTFNGGLVAQATSWKESRDAS